MQHIYQRQEKGLTHDSYKKSRTSDEDSVNSVQRNDVKAIVGNHAILRCCNGVIQSKLKVRSPNDKYEQEADMVAEKVMRMQGPLDEKEIISSNLNENHRNYLINLISKIPDGHKELGKARTIVRGQKKGVQFASPSLENNIKKTSGQGSPLPDSTRSFMESRLVLISVTLGYTMTKIRLFLAES